MIKRFIGYYRAHQLLLWTDLGAAVVFALCNLLYPRFTQTMLKELIPAAVANAGVLSVIWQYAALLLGIFLLKYAVNYYMTYYGHVMGVRMQADMRADLFRHLQRLPCNFYDNHKTGSLMSRLTNDLFNITELAHHGPEDLLISLIQFIGAFVLMALINPPLTLISVCLVPVMFFFAAKKRRALSAAFTRSREAVAEISAGLENSISGIRVTMAYNASDRENAKFDTLNGEYEMAQGTAYREMGSFHSFLGLCMDLLALLVLVAGAMFAVRGRVSYDELVAFILYVGVFTQPIARMVAFVEQYQNGMTGFRRFVELMEAPPEEDAPGAVELAEVAGDITFRHVSFAYDEQSPVLTDINFHIPRGKTLALVGSSGGGKTTICHLLARFYEPTAGEILLDGQDIRTFTRASLRQAVGIMAQDVFLFNASVFDNIAYGKEGATLEQVRAAAAFAGIDEFISSLPDGYDTVTGERGVKLSGGQKQRIAIARIFLKNPPILILDEATSALDNVTERQIQANVAALGEGRTKLVVAHRLSTVQHADEILLIDKEGILERGTHEELLAKGGAYAQLVFATE
ncbi:MAG: ABC transporter ATP-binding protein [Eubacteriales bacterium]